MIFLRFQVWLEKSWFPKHPGFTTQGRDGGSCYSNSSPSITALGRWSPHVVTYNEVPTYRTLVVWNIFYFHPEPWANDPIWLIFFKWVETTNSQECCSFKVVKNTTTIEWRGVTFCLCKRLPLFLFEQPSIVENLPDSDGFWRHLPSMVLEKPGKPQKARLPMLQWGKHSCG